MVGDYVSKVDFCIETNDFSVLQPLTWKDFIWLYVAKHNKNKQQSEYDIAVNENKSVIAESLYMAICDLRELMLDTNTFVRVNAYKDTKMKKVDVFDVKKLPSIRTRVEKEEAEKISKMTPEQIAEKEYRDFMAGKTIRR